MAPPRSRYFIVIILLIAVASLFFSLSKGSTSTSLYQLIFAKNNDFLQTIFELRLTRTMAAFSCGGLLALAGLLMQLLLQNPMADPYVLGVSSGAALGILLCMTFGVSAQWIIGGGMCGSMMSILLIILLAAKHRWQTNSLLLIGIALASGFTALISFILLLSPAPDLQSMMYWLSGDLNNVTRPIIGLLVLIIGCVTCFVIAPGLNILARGDHQARALGLSASKYKFALYLLSSIFTATAVVIAGSIGFIGLIIPHFTRRLVGYNHYVTVPAAALLGGSLLTCADALARSLFAPTQLPVGILIAMIGVPVFICLLKHN